MWDPQWTFGWMHHWNDRQDCQLFFKVPNSQTKERYQTVSYLRLCAGSVDIRSTFLRTLQSCHATGSQWVSRQRSSLWLLLKLTWIPRQQLVVVLPTPPLPPTKIHRRVCWSTTFSSVGGNSSSICTSPAPAAAPPELAMIHAVRMLLSSKTNPTQGTILCVPLSIKSGYIHNRM